MKPEILATGDAFEKLVTSYYVYQAVGAPDAFFGQIGIRKADGQRGRMDVFSTVEGDEPWIVILETKCSRWDKIYRDRDTDKILKSHADQMWNYLLGRIDVSITSKRRRERLERVFPPNTLAYLREIAVAEPRRRGVPYQWADVEQLSCTPAIIYPCVPGSKGLRERIEGFHSERGITVVWFDEPPPVDSPAHGAWTALESEIANMITPLCERFQSYA